MRRCWMGMIVVGLMIGCGPAEPPREAARPLASPPTDTIPAVNGPKPEATDPAAAKLLNETILAHTASEPARLERLRKVRTRRSGQYNLGDTVSAATMEVWIWGDQYRATYAIESQGNRPHTFSLRGIESGWQLVPVGAAPMPTPLDPATLARVLPDVATDRLVMLTPLIGPDVVAQVAHGSDEARPIIRVWIGQLPPVLLHLDATKRIRRISYESRELGQTVPRSLSFGDYVPVQGVLLPSQIEFGLGSVVQTAWTKIEYEVPGQFDLTIFDKP